jgi:MinD-like ATPase involved in chromosome partitioning or flagellar assembly
VERALNDYLWGRCPIEETACDVTATAIAGASESEARPRLFLIPSSLKVGEIARVLREGYDVALLNDGFRGLVRGLDLDYLFIDTHPGVNEETLLSIAVSNLFLLVMRPDNQDFQGTAITLELARRLEVPEIAVVVNKVPTSTDPESVRRQIESAYHVPVAALLPLNLEMAGLGSSGLFVVRYPDHPLTDALRRLAQRIIVSGASTTKDERSGSSDGR